MTVGRKPKSAAPSRITIHEAKTQLSKLIERALAGEDIVISSANHPVVRLVPVEARPAVRQFGAFKGKAKGLPRSSRRCPTRNSITGNEMRALLDTHALLWWLDGDRKLSTRARHLIERDDVEIFVSAASAWEIATKMRSGKLPGAVEVAEDLPGVLRSQRFTSLSITVRHAQAAGLLVWPRRDPFDRMHAAQAILEGMPLVSVNGVFDETEVTRFW